jgi:hypothetical protein
MAYVKRFDYDVFVSYAHNDNDGDQPWVTRFVEDIKIELRKRLGADRVEVFQDVSHIRGNEVLEDLKHKAQRSALFVPIVSPTYVAHRWTMAELRAFNDNPDCVKRIFAIEMLPLDSDAHYPAPLDSLIRTPFWKRRSESAAPITLNRTLAYEDYHNSVADFVDKIRTELIALRDEPERLKREEAERVEAARKAVEKEAAERMAREARAEAERQRLAREAAEQQARAERLKLAEAERAEAAEKKAQADAAMRADREAQAAERDRLKRESAEREREKLAREAAAALEAIGKVFISARTDDAGDYALRLEQRLARELGAANVVYQPDKTPVTTDIQGSIYEAVRRAGIVIVVIGHRWFDPSDRQNRARLHHSHDPVRLQIEAALELRRSIVPIVLDGATLPAAKDLPESLRPLLRLKRQPASHQGLDGEIDAIMRALRTHITLAKPPPAPKLEDRVAEEVVTGWVGSRIKTFAVLVAFAVAVIILAGGSGESGVAGFLLFVLLIGAAAYGGYSLLSGRSRKQGG